MERKIRQTVYEDHRSISRYFMHGINYAEKAHVGKFINFDRKKLYDAKDWKKKTDLVFSIKMV